MPFHNLDRAEAVSRFLQLEVNRRAELQQIVNLAADICNTEMALITLVDEQMQYVQFRYGFQSDENVLDEDFCNSTIESGNIFEIDDALNDPAFNHNPLVVYSPHLRFYAGVPLATTDGYVLGCLSVIGLIPGALTQSQRKMLVALSRQIIQIIDFDVSIAILKEQVQQLQRSEVKLRSFFESTVSCHLLVGKHHEVLAYNKIIATFIKQSLGVDIKEQMHVSEFLHHDYLDEFLDNYQAALKGQIITSEKELTYPDGRTIYWYMSLEPAFGKEMNVIGVSFNAVDVTERIRQERLVFKQDQALRQIAFVQSHELRRPVSSILGIVELIKSEEIPSCLNEEIMMLDQATKELDGKIRQIISFTN